MCGKNFLIYGVHVLRKCIDSRHFYSCPSPPLSRPGQTEITHSLRQHSFKYLFLPTAERGEGNYDLLYQNSVRKNEDELELQVFYILYYLQFFQM